MREDQPPGAQERSHGDHEPHDDILQSLAQTAVLQVMVFVNGPPHALPPNFCWLMMVRVDVLLPLPHVLLHGLVSHEEYTQSRGHACTLQ